MFLSTNSFLTAGPSSEQAERILKREVKKGVLLGRVIKRTSFLYYY